MSDETYCYPPDFTVLRNRFGISDADELDRLEREFVATRMRGKSPDGTFDLRHLQAIHRHLFQDVYAWAGELRTVEIAKGGNQFQFRRFIETGMSDVHRRLIVADFLQGLSTGEFAVKAGAILGDVNYVHPFREGNGRAQVIYLWQLAAQAGHRLRLERLNKEEWMAASREAHLGRHEAMGACIAVAMGPKQNREHRARQREQ